MAVEANQRVTVSSPLLGEQSVAYYDDGGEGPVVVFVHPNSCAVASWERQLADAAAGEEPNPLTGFRRVAFDLPGHGGTTRSGPGTNAYSLPFYAEALVAFANELALEGAFFVGHSLGGHAVIEAGARLPKPAGALIFGSPPVSTHEQLGGAFVSIQVACLDDVPDEVLVAAPILYQDGRNDAWWQVPAVHKHL